LGQLLAFLIPIASP